MVIVEQRMDSWCALEQRSFGKIIYAEFHGPHAKTQAMVRAAELNDQSN